jgi:DNA-binding phage protein
MSKRRMDIEQVSAPIVREVLEIVNRAEKTPTELQREANLNANTLLSWRKGENVSLSSLEKMTNALGLRLELVPINQPSNESIR